MLILVSLISFILMKKYPLQQEEGRSSDRGVAKGLSTPETEHPISPAQSVLPTSHRDKALRANSSLF